MIVTISFWGSCHLIGFKIPFDEDALILLMDRN